MDLATTVSALWIAVYGGAVITAFAIGRAKEKKQELQPIRIKEKD
jgi:hypothetical protein